MKFTLLFLFIFQTRTESCYEDSEMGTVAKRVGSHYDRFFNEYFDAYGTLIVHGRLGNGKEEDHYNEVAKKAMITDGEMILDMGCGVGGLLNYFAQFYPKCNLHGITASEKQVSYASSILKNFGDRIHVVKGDFTRPLPNPLNSFQGKYDLLIYQESLGYISDLKEAIQAGINNLNEKGRVFIKDYCLHKDVPNEVENKLIEGIWYSLLRSDEVMKTFESLGFKLHNYNSKENEKHKEYEGHCGENIHHMSMKTLHKYFNIMKKQNGKIYSLENMFRDLNRSPNMPSRFSFIYCCNFLFERV